VRFLLNCSAVAAVERQVASAGSMATIVRASMPCQVIPFFFSPLLSLWLLCPTRYPPIHHDPPTHPRRPSCLPYVIAAEENAAFHCLLIDVTKRYSDAFSATAHHRLPARVNAVRVCVL
jgi:hypothetical protein